MAVGTGQKQVVVSGKGGRPGDVERGRPTVSTAAGGLERGCGAAGSTR